MRFSDKRYYIEEYIKCANCGVLIYDEGVREPGSPADAPLHCSEWCIQWAGKRAAGEKDRVVPLPRD